MKSPYRWVFLPSVAISMLNTSLNGPFRQVMASDITWEKTQRIWVEVLTTYRRTNAQVQTVTRKNHSSKPLETISNVSKTVSNKFIQLRKPLTMVCTTTGSLPKCTKQHAIPNVRHFPAQKPSRKDGNVKRYDKAMSTNTYP